MPTPHRKSMPITPMVLESLEPRRLLGGDPFNLDASRVVLSTPDTYRTLASGDLDDDGDLDLVVSAGPRLYTQLNNGNGRFSAPVVNRITGVATQLLIADFDGDGTNDLAAFGRGAGMDNLLRVFKGDGDGTFTRITSIKLNATTILAGNFDTDARREIVATFGERFAIYQMNACVPNSPRFSSMLASKGERIDAVSAVDMDFDGVTDVIVGINSFDTASVSVSLVKPASFPLVHVIGPDLPDAQVSSVSAGNVVGTTRPDVIVAGLNLDGLDGSRYGVWVARQTNPGGVGGGAVSFNDSLNNIFDHFLKKTPVGVVTTLRFELLGTSNIDDVIERDIPFRFIKETTNSNVFPATHNFNTFLAVAFNRGGGRFTTDITNGIPTTQDKFPTYAIAPYQTASPRPDLIYVQLSDTPGGNNKVRYAENFIV